MQESLGAVAVTDTQAPIDILDSLHRMGSSNSPAASKRSRCLCWIAKMQAQKFEITAYVD